MVVSLTRLPKQICICGGGSIAHVLAAVIGARGDVKVRVLTRRPQSWRHHIRVMYRDTLEVRGTVDRVSSDPKEVVPGAEIVFATWPCAARSEMLSRIAPWVEDGAWVGALPAFGGFQWTARVILGNRCPLFGSQRIPFVCHTLTYGQSVRVTGVRPQTFVAASPATRVWEIRDLLSELLHTRIVPLPNFMSVALTPTNPIMNPARLYSLFSDWRPGVTYPRRCRFYADWDDGATQVFGRCDAELQVMCHTIPLDLHYVRPIVQHYEVATLPDVTRAIRELTPLQGRTAPLVRTAKGFVPDLTKSYFTEDIPYGIVVVRSIAEVAGVPTPAIDDIIRWAEGITGASYFRNGRIDGSDSYSLPTTRQYGIREMADLVRE